MKKVLSDADVTKLRRTMADVDKLRGQIRTLHDRSKSSKRAGAHYVVKTPSGGIPASVGDEPGSADCNIHIRDGDPKELRDTTRAETVYNFGPAIPGDTILIAHRDAWGDLWAGEPSSGGVCEELDLQPGSYRGIAGATTAPGETGPVIVTGCEDEVTIDAVNHSGCTFYLGDMITVNVDPCCVAHFTGCSCCGAEDTPPACCDRSIVICIAGERQILAVNGGTYTWDVSECCDCEGATLEVTLSCDEPGGGGGGGGGGGPGGEEPPGEPLGAGPGGGATISADWEYTCGESTASGTIDIESLCDDEADVEILGELDDICDGNLNDRWANFVEDCEPCGPVGPVDPCENPDDCVDTDCCPDNLIPKTLSATIVGGTEAGTYSMTFAANEWVVDGGEPFTLRLACLGGGNFWELTVELESYGETTASCDPFALTFDTSFPANGIGATSVSIS
jgi:hypothetical protein